MGAILPIVETACSLLVQQTIISSSLNIPTSSVFTGIDNEERTLPEVVCWAEEAEQIYLGVDWWRVKTTIIVAHRAFRQDRNEATTIANTIFDAFYDVSASVSLTNTTSSFTCADVLDKRYMNTMEQDAWVQSVSFTMIVSPSD